jgi:hypothetical protein
VIVLGAGRVDLREAVRPGLRVHYGRQLAPSSAVGRYGRRLADHRFVTSDCTSLGVVGVSPALGSLGSACGGSRDRRLGVRTARSKAW